MCVEEEEHSIDNKARLFPSPSIKLTPFDIYRQRGRKEIIPRRYFICHKNNGAFILGFPHPRDDKYCAGDN